MIRYLIVIFFVCGSIELSIQDNSIFRLSIIGDESYDTLDEYEPKLINKIANIDLANLEHKRHSNSHSHSHSRSSSSSSSSEEDSDEYPIYTGNLKRVRKIVIL